MDPLNTWFTSDHHLGHTNIIKYCNRPYESVGQMDEDLIRLWNETVPPEGVVYYLGDFSMDTARVPRILPRLNGTKILYAGNHDKCFKGADRWVKFYRDAGFSEVHPGGKGLMILTSGRDPDLWRGCHLPYTTYDERYLDKLPIDDGKPLLCGHVHEKWLWKKTPKGTVQVNVGVDAQHFRPVSYSRILQIHQDAKRSSETICSVGQG